MSNTEQQKYLIGSHRSF